MKTSRIGPVLLYTALAVILLAGGGILDVRIDWRDNVAQALDLFGDDEPKREATAKAEQFWQENGLEAEAIVPNGVPASFADLSERVSPGVVNIQTSKTVKGTAYPRFEDFFFGGPFHGGPGEQHCRVGAA